MLTCCSAVTVLMPSGDALMIKAAAVAALSVQAMAGIMAEVNASTTVYMVLLLTISAAPLQSPVLASMHRMLASFAG